MILLVSFKHQDKALQDHNNSLLKKVSTTLFFELSGYIYEFEIDRKLGNEIIYFSMSSHQIFC